MKKLCELEIGDRFRFVDEAGPFNTVDKRGENFIQWYAKGNIGHRDSKHPDWQRGVILEDEKGESAQ